MSSVTPVDFPNLLFACRRSTRSVRLQESSGESLASVLNSLSGPALTQDIGKEDITTGRMPGAHCVRRPRRTSHDSDYLANVPHRGNTPASHAPEQNCFLLISLLLHPKIRIKNGSTPATEPMNTITSPRLGPAALWTLRS